MNKILLTGGAGFVGSNLLNLLIKSKYEVLVIDNLSTGKSENIPQNIDEVNFLNADITDKKSIERSITDYAPEAVIHLAAIHFIPYCNEYPEETFKTNVIGTRNLLDICKSVRPDIFIFASSAAVYGISDSPVKENDPLDPMDIYGFTKLVGEDLCRLFHYETNIATIMCRIFNVYGPGETNPHVIPEIIEQFINDNKSLEIGNITPKRDFIHVFDLVNAIVSLMTSFKSGVDVFNLGSGIEYSVGEIIDFCKEITHKNPEVKSTESRSRKSDRMHLLSDISKIKKSTDWRPLMSMIEGLSKLINT